MHILSKSTYIKGEQCVKALYLFKNRPFLRDKLSMEQRAKFKRGTDVGLLAQQYFPGGINMTPSSPSQFGKKIAETMQNLSNPEISVSDISVKLNISVDGAKYHLNKLRKNGLIYHEGPTNGGRWKVNDL